MKSSEIFAQKLKDESIAHELHNLEKGIDLVVIGTACENLSRLIMNVYFDANNTSCSVMASPIGKIPDDRKDKVIHMLNALNCQYRWVKFYLIENGDIVTSMYVRFTEATVAELVQQSLFNFVSIIDNSYSSLMKGIYG